MDINRIFLLPDDILWNILSFDTRFVLRFDHSHSHNKWMLIFIDKIPKDDFRYAILQKRIIITKEYRRNSSYFQNQNQTNKIVLKQHKNISSIIIYDNNDFTDIEFSHYLYQTIQMYHYF